MAILLEGATIVEVKVCCYTPTQIGLNVLHYYVSNVAMLGITIQEASAALDARFAPNWKGVVSSSARYRGVSVTVVSPGARTLEFPTVANDGPGAGGSNLNPTQVSGLVTLRSLVAGRKARGRVYLPFPPAASNTVGGDQSFGYAIAAISVDIAMGPNIHIVGASGSCDLNQVIWRRRLPPGQSAFVATYSNPAKWATQRRRGQFGRTNALPW